MALRQGGGERTQRAARQGQACRVLTLRAQLTGRSVECRVMSPYFMPCSTRAHHMQYIKKRCTLRVAPTQLLCSLPSHPGHILPAEQQPSPQTSKHTCSLRVNSFQMPTKPRSHAPPPLLTAAAAVAGGPPSNSPSTA